MLLCLSNIGDIMATSFRFLYWKVCCYVCTKKPKKPKRARSTRSVQRTPNRTWRSRTASFRRSARTSTRSQDSGFGRSEFASTSHSDTELRYHDEMPRLRSSPSEVYRHQQHQHQNRPNSSIGIERGGASSSHRSRYSEATTASVATASALTGSRGGSLDRRKMQAASSRNLEAMVDSSNVEKTSVYCNRYAMEKMDHSVGNHVNQTKKFSRPKQFPSPPHGRRAISMPRTQYHLELPRDSSPTSSLYHERGDTGGGEDSSIKSSNTLTTTRQKRKKPAYHPSPAIMSPLGYGHRSKYLDDPVSDDDYATDNNDYYDSERVRTRPVPIWLCVFLVISYIIAGTFLFAHWESWSYLNSAYFCFITLTTIGFGDLFPSQRVEDLSGYKQNIAFCSLYLLFGIALLAMSFNLVQEEVIANVKKVAKTLGIIKPDDDDDDDDDE
nr:uncharacterized protein LOC111421454 [Onthophagus taurus]XP_022910382.1 uncharacterized protein LOC111421454 [Onthophagus taurus]